MRYVYGIYSSLIKEVQDLADSVTKTMRELTGSSEEVRFGWKICEYTITAKKRLSEAELKKITDIVKEHYEKIINGKKFWIKLERTEKGTSDEVL